jgi:hypothetical protein
MYEVQASELSNTAMPGATIEAHKQLPELYAGISGAISHDLNNTLMVISAHCELLLDSIPAEDPRQKYAQRIQNATRKAVTIADMLFAFSRPHVAPTAPIDFDSTLAELIPVLNGIAGKQRPITYSAGPGVKTVNLARGLVTQVILATLAAACNKLASSQSFDIDTGLMQWPKTNSASHIILNKGYYIWMSVAISVANSPDQVTVHSPELGSREGWLGSIRNLVQCCGGDIVVLVDRGEITITVYLPRFVSSEDQKSIQTGSVIGVAETSSDLPNQSAR